MREGEGGGGRGREGEGGCLGVGAQLACSDRVCDLELGLPHDAHARRGHGSEGADDAEQGHQLRRGLRVFVTGLRFGGRATQGTCTAFAVSAWSNTSMADFLLRATKCQYTIRTKCQYTFVRQCVNRAQVGRRLQQRASCTCLRSRCLCRRRRQQPTGAQTLPPSTPRPCWR
jgi:hypothetical protein